VLFTVGLILVAFFRQFGLALAGLAVNAIPILLGFGAMGLLGIPIDAGTVVVGSIAFGIAVDDTIHTATEFSNRIESGEDSGQAIVSTYSRVLRPIAFTTAVVSVGFVVLGLSEFALIRNLGLITAAVMVACLLADLFLFPALLLLLHRV